MKRNDVATGLSEQFERGLREGVARARASRFRRPNWPLVAAMLVLADTLFIGSAAMGALMGDAVRNYLFILALFPASIVIALLYCDRLKTQK